MLLSNNRVITRYANTPTATVCRVDVQMPTGRWLDATYDEYRRKDASGDDLTENQRRILAQVGATIILLDKVNDLIIYGDPEVDDEENAPDEPEVQVEDSQTEDRPVDRGTASMEAYASGVGFPEYCVVCNGRCEEADNYYRSLGERYARGELS